MTHIVMITCHDLGRHLGCYGVGTVRTPHLDALAAAGVRFDRAYCTSPGCSPSRSSLATGRYPHNNGVLGLAHDPFGWDLAPGERHMAGLLRERGYETHLFGLQHVTLEVERLGFDRVHNWARDLGHLKILGPEIAASVASVLEAPPGSPLYLELNLEEPHRPYHQGGVQPDETLGVYVPPFVPDGPEAREEFAALQGAIHAADETVGRVLAALEGAGLSDDTLVVFTADHGLAMPRAKCTLYDPGLEVALLMRWPAGGLGAGRAVGELLSNVDVAPTLLEAAGAPIPSAVQGRSFLPLLRGGAYEPRSEVYAEKTFHSYYDPIRAIRTHGHKLIRNWETTYEVEAPADVQEGAIFRSAPLRYHGRVHPELELYDLESDPLELRNLAEDPANAGLALELDGRLWTWMERTDDPLLRGPVPSPAHGRSLAARPAEANPAAG